MTVLRWLGPLLCLTVADCSGSLNCDSTCLPVIVLHESPGRGLSGLMVSGSACEAATPTCAKPQGAALDSCSSAWVQPTAEGACTIAVGAFVQTVQVARFAGPCGGLCLVDSHRNPLGSADVVVSP